MKIYKLYLFKHLKYERNNVCRGGDITDFKYVSKLILQIAYLSLSYNKKVNKKR